MRWCIFVHTNHSEAPKQPISTFPEVCEQEVLVGLLSKDSLLSILASPYRHSTNQLIALTCLIHFITVNGRCILSRMCASSSLYVKLIQLKPFLKIFRIRLFWRSRLAGWYGIHSRQVKILCSCRKEFGQMPIV